MKETVRISVGMCAQEPGSFLKYAALQGDSFAKWHDGKKIDSLTATVLINALFDVTDIRLQDYNRQR